MSRAASAEVDALLDKLLGEAHVPSMNRIREIVAELENRVAQLESQRDLFGPALDDSGQTGGQET